MSGPVRLNVSITVRLLLICDCKDRQETSTERARRLEQQRLRSGGPTLQTVAGKQLRAFDDITLSVIHADFKQCLLDLGCFDKLRNCLLTHDMPDVVDHFDHSAVNRVVQHILYETPVDLQEVYRQMFQISE